MDFTALPLGPAFASDTKAYTATVEHTSTHVTLTPTVHHRAATVQVGQGTNLTAVPSGQVSAALALRVGANALTVTVTAEDRTTTQTYTVTVTPAARSAAARSWCGRTT